MRESSRGSRGFTLVELVAVIVIMAIVAAVSFPRMTAANSFAAMGYGDAVAASLRQARAKALASGCDVQFVIDNAGYRARQRSRLNNHCDAAGAFALTVFDGIRPANVPLAVPRQIVFSGITGNIGAATTITLGPRVLTVDASGMVQ